MDSKDGTKVAEAIISAINTIVTKTANRLGFDQTVRGKVVEETIGGTYTVQVYNKNYPNIKPLNSTVYHTNDTVWCLVPRNQWTQMFILGKI